MSDAIKTDAAATEGCAAVTGSALTPIGPSSDDFYRFMNARHDLDERMRDGTFNRHTGYEIWRNAWMACEREHGIRPHAQSARASSAGDNGPTSDAGAGSPTAEAGGGR